MTGFSVEVWVVYLLFSVLPVGYTVFLSESFHFRYIPPLRHWFILFIYFFLQTRQFKTLTLKRAFS